MSPASAGLHWFLSRYDRNSLFAWGVLAAVYIGVAIKWSYLLDFTRGMDWLLAGIWSFMTLLLAWDIRPARDTSIAVVAFFGGLVIEWWGTTTQLWHYFTADRPPLWILPAWPVAALAIDRMTRVGERVRVPTATWLLIPAFVVWMTHFLWGTIDISSSRVVVGLMIGVLLTARNLRSDATIFLAGGLLGIFLEYWGTSRLCWTYYTRETPPLVAAFAHGFASIAFSRGAAVILRLHEYATGRLSR